MAFYAERSEKDPDVTFVGVEHGGFSGFAALGGDSRDALRTAAALLPVALGALRAVHRRRKKREARRGRGRG